METAIWTLLITSLLGAIGWLYKSEREKRASIENQLSKDKYSVYLSIMNQFTDILHLFVPPNSLTDEQRLAKLNELNYKTIDITKQLIIYGSDTVLKRYSYYRQNAKETTPILNLKLFYEVMLAIRKDMGHPDTIATPDELLGVFISDYATLRDEILAMK